MRPERRPADAGVTLVELMVSFTLFTIMSLGAIAALGQTRIISENNVAHATANAIAQGIIEQVQLNGYTNITSDPSLPLKFTGASSANLASLQQFSLPWAADATTFTDIGSRADPTDPNSPVLGVLVDVAYKNGANVIRPAHYMKMKVNLQRNPHLNDDNVEIILTYSWQPISANGTSSGAFFTREIRTIRSQAPSY